MKFRPLGDPFEITPLLPPAELKAALRARAKPWFEAKSGSRGWVAGPFVCLWLGAFDRHGPMLFGVVSEDGAGSRVRGRAGSDLNGILSLLLLVPLMVWTLATIAADAAQALGQVLASAA